MGSGVGAGTARQVQYMQQAGGRMLAGGTRKPKVGQRGPGRACLGSGPVSSRVPLRKTVRVTTALYFCSSCAKQEVPIHIWDLHLISCIPPRPGNRAGDGRRCRCPLQRVCVCVCAFDPYTVATICLCIRISRLVRPERLHNAHRGDECYLISLSNFASAPAWAIPMGFPPGA